jgi:hypothetical protein
MRAHWLSPQAVYHHFWFLLLPSLQVHHVSYLVTTLIYCTEASKEYPPVPDLELGTVRVQAILDVDALVAVDLDLPVLEQPLLVDGTRAGLDDDRGTVHVIGLEALGGVVAGCDETFNVSFIS